MSSQALHNIKVIHSQCAALSGISPLWFLIRWDSHWEIVVMEGGVSGRGRGVGGQEGSESKQPAASVMYV